MPLIALQMCAAASARRDACCLLGLDQHLRASPPALSLLPLPTLKALLLPRVFGARRPLCPARPPLAARRSTDPPAADQLPCCEARLHRGLSLVGVRQHAKRLLHEQLWGSREHRQDSRLVNGRPCCWRSTSTCVADSPLCFGLWLQGSSMDTACSTPKTWPSCAAKKDTAAGSTTIFSSCAGSFMSMPCRTHPSQHAGQPPRPVSLQPWHRPSRLLLTGHSVITWWL